MATERTSITQTSQVGVEATPGTPVAANKKLVALSINPAVRVNISRFRPYGQKYPALLVPNQEWVEASLEGAPTYSELIYPLASILTNPTVAEVLDGATPTGAHRWTFEPSSTLEDDPLTFTVEQGSAFRAHRFAHGLVTEFTMTVGRDALSLGGSMIGTRLEDPITLTASPTSLDLVPILPTQIDVFVDDDAASLGTTKLGRALSAEFGISNRFGPLWVLDSTLDSWAAHVELEPDATFSMMMMADAQSMELLNTMRAGDSKFIRLRAVGDQIYSGAIDVDYQMDLEVAVKVDEVGDFSDEDGVYAIEWTTRLVHDTTWGRAVRAEITNEIAAL